ncbi:MAG: hypothetical protein MZU91_11880 [Desulfosudis oleivorans]|nr:hypothetical protein [Desulfosudis oleivorans]
MKPKVLVTRTIQERPLALLREQAEVVVNPHDRSMTLEEIIAELPGKAAMMAMGGDPVNEKLLGASRDLKIVANNAVGFNNMDVEAATRLKIALTNTPDVLTDTTADLSLRDHDGRGPADLRGGAIRARREMGGLAPEPSAGQRHPREDARRRRAGPDRGGRGQAGSGIQHEDPLQRHPQGRVRPDRHAEGAVHVLEGPAGQFRFRDPPRAPHPRNAPSDRPGRAAGDEKDGFPDQRFPGTRRGRKGPGGGPAEGSDRRRRAGRFRVGAESLPRADDHGKRGHGPPHRGARLPPPGRRCPSRPPKTSSPS